jgi:hypothetical protein
MIGMALGGVLSELGRFITASTRQKFSFLANGILRTCRSQSFFLLFMGNILSVDIFRPI